MEKLEIANLITAYRHEFAGRIPNQRIEEERDEFVAIVNAFHKRFGAFPISQLEHAFEQHLKNTRGFFPKTGELFPYFRITDHPDHIPTPEETQALIAEREKMIAEAKARQTPEHMERMKRHHDKIAEILGLEKDESGALQPNRKFRVDFNIDETGND